MPFTMVRDDITKMKTDAVVNAANTGLQMGGGVCGAIFRAAGVRELQAACQSLAPIQTGEATVTPGFALPARYIIHTAGPVYRGGGQGEREQLYACYWNSLVLAAEKGCESIAFPLISSGIYGYPKKEALQVATQAIGEFLEDSDMDVYLAVFDKDAFALGELLGGVESYIDEHYVDERERRDGPRRRPLRPSGAPKWDAFRLPQMLPAPRADGEQAETMPASSGMSILLDLDKRIGNLDEPFSQTLLRWIDAKGKTDVEVYKRANLDRRLFSKIRSGKQYMPGKRTVLALAVALELTLRETEDLLERAGYALSHSQKFDVILEYFIVGGRYDILEINEVLFFYDQPLLGGGG